MPFSDTEMQSMMQSMLADRFHLAVHQDTREFPGYVLSVAKGGLKLPRTTNSDPKQARALSYRRDPATGAILLGATDIPIGDFAVAFGTMMVAPIRDDTGVEGNFDVKLRFTVDPNAGVSDVPPLTTAMQEQLGQHLEAAKLPQDVIVVDLAEKPSEN
jgi:uncharacterized protein (TIGR03435 family)